MNNEFIEKLCIILMYSNTLYWRNCRVYFQCVSSPFLLRSVCTCNLLMPAQLVVVVVVLACSSSLLIPLLLPVRVKVHCNFYANLSNFLRVKFIYTHISYYSQYRVLTVLFSLLLLLLVRL